MKINRKSMNFIKNNKKVEINENSIKMNNRRLLAAGDGCQRLAAGGWRRLPAPSGRRRVLLSHFSLIFIVFIDFH